MKKCVRQSHQMEYLFCRRDGSQIKDFKKTFISLLRRSGISDSSIHTMRHTYASHLAMAGVSIGTIKDLLGHEDIETTMIYAHLAPEHKHHAVQNLPFLLNGSNQDKSFQTPT